MNIVERGGEKKSIGRNKPKTGRYDIVLYIQCNHGGENKWLAEREREGSSLLNLCVRKEEWESVWEKKRERGFLVFVCHLLPLLSSLSPLNVGVSKASRFLKGICVCTMCVCVCLQGVCVCVCLQGVCKCIPSKSFTSSYLLNMNIYIAKPQALLIFPCTLVRFVQ